MTAEQGRAYYLDIEGEAGYAVLHEPSGGRRATSVLIIPPFGWEETCSYRTRRAWAVALAHDGFPALRLDLPGTGDSAGTPDDQGQVDSWIRAIRIAADELGRMIGCNRVAAIGLGLGGLLACMASADGARLDELVLWGVPARGRTIIRELRAFAQLAASRQAGSAPLPEGAFTVNGFLISAETAISIGDLDVRTSPGARVQRALLLERDTLPVDETLRATLVAGQTDVTVAAGPGYGLMMAEPQFSISPWKVIATVSTWLAEGAVSDGARPPFEGLRTSATFAAAGSGVRERLLALDLPDGHLAGVLTEPTGEVAPLCAVLLNAGAIRRTGPNRMWVEAARRWALRGVPSVRLDLASIGDSDSPDISPFQTAHLYEPGYGRQVRGALDALVQSGLPSRFLLMGLCSGAYWSFQVGQVDPRVAGVILLNPLALVFDPFLRTIRTSGYVRQLARVETWQRILHGKVSRADAVSVASAVARRGVTAPGRLPTRVAARRRARAAGGDELDQELDRLRDNGVQALVVFSAAEPLREEMARAGRFEHLDRWPNVRLYLLDGPLGTHTLQPLHLQDQVHALIDSALDPLLGSSNS